MVDGILSLEDAFALEGEKLRGRVRFGVENDAVVVSQIEEMRPVFVVFGSRTREDGIRGGDAGEGEPRRGVGRKHDDDGEGVET